VLQTNPFGPIGAGPTAIVLGTQQQGYLKENHMSAYWTPFSVVNASFQISGAVSNLANLPFVPSFSSSNMVPGQNVYVTTEATSFGVPGGYIPATTLTLVPQSINATVNSVSASGAFQDYSVSLAVYDLFPTLAVQAGQPALLSSPSRVEVYVDASTQQFNKQALAPGSTLRFSGLVFNDNGTLRMDCVQINDGVTASSQSNSVSASSLSQATTTVRSMGQSVQQLTTMSPGR
jgi:hypothetical protein